MVIAAHAIDAHEGILYIRAEYPLAVRRINDAIGIMKDRGFLGGNICGSGFGLSLGVMEGAGAFVSGEETALLAAVEGRRSMPRFRPPYPAESGLWGKPTNINNVETYALVPWIIRNGAAAFSALGTATSRGTKVFALAGKVKRGGLIEVPMGITVREIVEEIGGGTAAGGPFKAVQIGGPSGGCIPASLGDTPVDYEALTDAGCIMGSGGLVALDETDCMVDIARYFMTFTQRESCGKCTHCRIGTKRMLEILNRLCEGRGEAGDLEKLEQLALTTRAGSLCGLGRTAPNPVLSTLKHFRGEYEAHIHGRCPARKCKALISYTITDDCIGCTRCAQHCPVDAIDLKPYRKHEIDQRKCARCDTCRLVCPSDAVKIVSPGIAVKDVRVEPGTDAIASC
jgi:NADH-quinone oxidoreductase subunit F